MAEPARRLDLIAPATSYGPADAAVLSARHAALAADGLIAEVLHSPGYGRVALVSSFGADAAVLLHMVAAQDPTVPIIFVDTGRLFPETLAYRDALIERLGLAEVRTLRPDPAAIALKDGKALRWSYDPDGCCALRKVEPLGRALTRFNVWISGRKAYQSKTRGAMPVFEADGPRLKLNPLRDWSAADVTAYAAAHDLPAHPLVAQGYPSIGCMPCTTQVQPGEDPRAGRWRGWDKVECGIHVPNPSEPAF